MKIIKVSEANGSVLDYAVCMAKGLKSEDIYIQKWGAKMTSLFRRNRDEDGNLDGSYTTGPDLLFSKKWEAGGPIIEREGICSDKPEMSSQWICDKRMGFGRICRQYGSTMLIAAMRCYVTSKLGEEVGGAR